jgi:hypothetical protein
MDAFHCFGFLETKDYIKTESYKDKFFNIVLQVTHLIFEPPVAYTRFLKTRVYTVENNIPS